MGNHGGDLLCLQVLSYELPALTGVYRAIDVLVCQGKENTGVSRTDEQLLDGSVTQTCVANCPRASPIIRTKNAVFLGAQVKGA